MRGKVTGHLRWRRGVVEGRVLGRMKTHRHAWHHGRHALPILGTGQGHADWLRLSSHREGYGASGVLMIEAHVQDSGLPVEAVEHLDGAIGIDVVGKEYSTKALGAVFWCQCDVGA